MGRKKVVDAVLEAALSRNARVTALAERAARPKKVGPTSEPAPRTAPPAAQVSKEPTPQPSVVPPVSSDDKQPDQADASLGLWDTNPDDVSQACT